MEYYYWNFIVIIYVWFICFVNGVGGVIWRVWRRFLYVKGLGLKINIFVLKYGGGGRDFILVGYVIVGWYWYYLIEYRGK